MIVKNYGIYGVYKAESLLDARAYFDAIKFADLTPSNTRQSVGVTKDLREEIQSGGDWYGKSSLVFEHDVVNGITKYLEPQIIDNVANSITSSLSHKLVSKLKKKKFKFNKNFGVFSFDRAAAGLYWLDELYSSAENRAVQESETRIANGKRSLISTGEELNSPAGRRFEYFPNAKVKTVGRKEARDDGSPFVRTNVEDVFIYFPEQPRQTPAVSLYFTAGGAGGQSAEELTYAGVEATDVAELYQRINVKTSIHGVYGNGQGRAPSAHHFPRKDRIRPENVFADWKYFIDIEVKKFNETIDRDAVCLLADARWFRYECFNWLIKICDQNGIDISNGLGSVLASPAYMLQVNTNYYNEHTTTNDTTKVFIPLLRSKEEAVDFIENVITNFMRT